MAVSMKNGRARHTGPHSAPAERAHDAGTSPILRHSIPPTRREVVGGFIGALNGSATIVHGGEARSPPVVRRQRLVEHLLRDAGRPCVV